MKSFFSSLRARPTTSVSPDSAQQSNINQSISSGVAAIARRLGYIMRQLLDAETAQSSRFSEVEDRIEAMITESARATQDMQSSMRKAEEIRQQSQHDFADASATISNGLIALEHSLADKLAKVSEVVQVLERTGKEMELIAINAAIQAARAGEAGRTFSVVAEHVRDLAKNTVKNSHEVSQMLDFSDFQQQLIGFGQSSAKNVSYVDQATGEAFAKVEDTFSAIKTSLDVLVDQGRVIETIHMLDKGSYQQQRVMVDWAKQIVDMLEKSRDLDPAQLSDLITRIVRKESLNQKTQSDRLQDIMRRGVLRVAIEPAFKGLSFRLRSAEPLRGLDVEYATAFAKYLGVRIEFVEHPWDQCVNLLHLGQHRGEQEVDVVWSALPPNASYHGVAYSEAYTYMHYMLARRVGDKQITDIASLQGKILGCINDPAAFATLEAAGLRWSKHKRDERGTIRLANLIGYTDQSIIHDALADCKVDAFAVDQPIFAWACYGKESPWHGRIEMIKGNIADTPWYYAAAVADSPSSYHLLKEINQFIEEFSYTEERQALEKRWQFFPVDGDSSYRDEPGNLKGETELQQDWLQINRDNALLIENSH
jgi:ABC-type amino acid transport substrate-binding protein